MTRTNKINRFKLAKSIINRPLCLQNPKLSKLKRWFNKGIMTFEGNVIKRDNEKYITILYGCLTVFKDLSELMYCLKENKIYEQK